jgi:hypothetical protein
VLLPKYTRNRYALYGSKRFRLAGKILPMVAP